MLPISPNGKDLGRYVALGQVGLEMVVPIGIGLLVDYYLDWGHWGAVVGTILGFTGGLAHLIHLVNKLDKLDKKDSDQDSSGPKSEAK
jgi:F0F1-type ATP synthase assembly protein I